MSYTFSRLVFLVVLFLGKLPMVHSQTPLIVAHRGSSQDAPENTLAAFRLAWKHNADAIEGDFFLTKDNRIVCTHDKSTKRFNKQDLTVANSTMAELQKLDVGSWHSKKFAGEKMPEISEVFATVPKGKVIYVEIKCGVEIVKPLLNAIHHSQLELKQIVIISFQERVIAAIKKAEPRLVANWLLKFDLNSENELVPRVDDVIKTLRKIKADGIGASHKNVSQNVVAQFKASGFGYHVWTIDEPDTARQFVKWGANSVTTNVPAAIRKSLKSTK